MRLRGARDATPRPFKDRGATYEQRHGFETDLLGAPRGVRQFRCKTLLPFEPVFAKQFNGMLGADVAVSAVHRISGTVFIASPAISFGVLRVNREFLCHLIGLLADGRREERLLASHRLSFSASSDLPDADCGNWHQDLPRSRPFVARELHAPKTKRLNGQPVEAFFIHPASRVSRP
jgi:hypothetical protein